MDKSQIHSDVEWTKPGKQHGHLYIPYSYNLAGWANLMVPVTTLVNGDGPTALVLAGNHGDEYPGQVAIPCLTIPGSKAMTRLSPLDGKNFNRCFPGKADGTVSEILAHYLTTVLFPLADIVFDIHTGGRSMDFAPCATMHLVSDKTQRRQMVEGTEAWNSDLAFLYADVAGTGLLPVEAERQGKIVITTEMGGGEIVTPAVHRLTQSGLRNVLIHFGVLKGEKAPRTRPVRWLQALDREDYRFAPESGIYENVVDVGADVKSGQTVGLIHFLERPDRAAEAVVARSAGVLICTRGPSLVAQGDCVACIAHDVPADVLRV
jgi:predicted deacylase